MGVQMLVIAGYRRPNGELTKVLCVFNQLQFYFHLTIWH